MCQGFIDSMIKVWLPVTPLPMCLVLAWSLVPIGSRLNRVADLMTFFNGKIGVWFSWERVSYPDYKWYGLVNERPVPVY